MAQFILFAPLLGALIAGFGWRIIGEKAAMMLTTGILFVAALFSWIVFLGFDGQTQHIPVMDWIVSGDFSAEWAIRLDRLTAIMLIVVTSVSALVHLYSMGYMAHDDNWTHHEHYKARFFAYLSFFTFAMLMLVTADNLLQMFFGWEGVGVASYLLIGFYYRKPSANAAAMKAFIVNRVGDFGFLMGIFGLWWMTGSIQFDAIFAQVADLANVQMRFLWTEWNAANLLAFLLFVGAMGKSAQLFLHTWLPDAMEGPTPVSALIHAATMVTAGVFLVCRMSPLFEFAPETKMFITIIGASTAFFAATVGLVQNDIKRVIAYSTCSQLGYMFVAAGVGVYSVAMFHLFTHAFFKAMLFLGAGSVIHAMHHEQDMRNYGGLRKKIPLTFWAMLIGTLAITGVGIPLTHIGFAGFLSKDAVIESAYASGVSYAFWLLVIAALMTSFYSWRLMFLTFWGAPRPQKVWDAEIKTEEEVQPSASHGHGHDAHGHGHGHDAHGHHDPLHAHHHAHESPPVMTVPLGILAIGAVFAGMIWYGSFFGDDVQRFFGLPEAAHEQAEGGHGEALDGAVAEAPHGEPAGAATHAAAGAASDPAEETAADGHAALAGFERGAIFMRSDNHVMHDAHYVPTWVKLSPFVAMLIGLGLSWLMYIRYPDAPAKLAAQQPGLYRFLLNKWYFDEIYHFVFVRPALWIGRKLWTGGDTAVIDGAINGVAMGIIPRLTRFAGRVQSGYVFHYAFAMVVGIVGLLIWVIMRGAH
ncbi:NADH-quinone oxidoreductase subunit L [Paracoccus aerius]|uniref:NADH-quinone oxidoreductase subunit L n=1 Tax=Paracoccus aerius TaxID=1915382 RepID=A0ABS1S7R7_9RHOB|nr:NADH-quinone oxidoreductase subunit L [Paracoccus aerius]MBL3674776.1 NADH-quinone oxidoreductase subunit L [Paracoccus aerius]GHG28443.1 NADH-quinone oxidoreductase subunit L [Paracoccus aerius]